MLGLPASGGPGIVLVEHSKGRAEDWLRQSRWMSGPYIRYRLYERVVSAAGLRIAVYVVVARRAVPGLRG